MTTRSEEDTIREAMHLLGSRTSARKKRTSKANGKLGGRPKGSTDSKPRERRWKVKPDGE